MLNGLCILDWPSIYVDPREPGYKKVQYVQPYTKAIWQGKISKWLRDPSKSRPSCGQHEVLSRKRALRWWSQRWLPNVWMRREHLRCRTFRITAWTCACSSGNGCTKQFPNPECMSTTKAVTHWCNVHLNVGVHRATTKVCGVLPAELIN